MPVIVVDQDQLFSCSLCVEVLKEPVALPCGHSYCSVCIEASWDQEAEEKKSPSSCPQCGETFCPRPALRRNHILAELVEKLRTPDVQQQSSVSAAPLYAAGPADVASDLQQKIQERKKDVKELREVMETLKSSAEAAVEASDQMFSEMKASVDRRHSQVKDMIRQLQEKTAVSQAEDVLRQLDEDIARLERTCAELEKLSHTDDITRFIQDVQSASSSSGPPALPSDVVSTLSSFTQLSGHPIFSSDVVSTLSSFTQLREHVSALRDDLDLLLNTPWTHTAESPADVSHPAEPQTREELLQYACPLSLDANTVQDNLALSEENRKVTRYSGSHDYIDHPRRFSFYRQALCRESLTERHYFEVEWNEREWVYIAVCYEDVNKRDRFQSGFGFNSKSWCLRCLGDDCWFTHNGIDTKVSKPTSYTRDVNIDPNMADTERYTYTFTFTKVGVYLDHKAGTLSFYGVCDNTATLLHTVHTTFTQPLYAGIGFHGPKDRVVLTSHKKKGGDWIDHTAEVVKIW